MASERGLALIPALVLVVVLGGTIAALSAGSRRLAAGDIDAAAEVRALQAADGGLQLALWALSRDVDFAGERLQIGLSTVEVVVERDGGVVRVRSLARCWPRGEHAPPRAVGVTMRVVFGDDGRPRGVGWRRFQ